MIGKPRPEMAISNPDLKNNNLEIEIKVVNLGSPEVLIAKILSLGGKLVKPKRRIQDTSFNLSKDNYLQVSEKTTLNITGIENLDDLHKMLDFLGLNIVKKENGGLVVTRKEVLPRRTMRIRNDGGILEWTAKEKREKNATHDEREELNVVIKSDASLVDFLEEVGYLKKNISEKDRESYEFNECLVEINYGPMAKPWAEIEGPSREKIFETAKILGYAESDLSSMSDQRYYESQGISKDQLQNMVFNKN
jgi:adenylate cyclase, class 2